MKIEFVRSMAFFVTPVLAFDKTEMMFGWLLWAVVLTYDKNS